MALYLDSSALVKLVAAERYSDDLDAYVADRRVVSSQIAITELIRAVARRHLALVDAADDLISHMSLLAVDRRLMLSAAWIQPRSIRSLDAIHLASAIGLGRGLDALVTYDRRMGEAARAAGLRVAMPGDEAA